MVQVSYILIGILEKQNNAAPVYPVVLLLREHVPDVCHRDADEHVCGRDRYRHEEDKEEDDCCDGKEISTFESAEEVAGRGGGDCGEQECRCRLTGRVVFFLVVNREDGVDGKGKDQIEGERGNYKSETVVNLSRSTLCTMLCGGPQVTIKPLP
jgi:hypothetical protein